MSRIYYPVWYRLDNADGYLLWYSNEQDGVLLGSDGRVPSFATLPALQQRALEQQIELNPSEPGLHNLDVIAHWLQRPLLHDIDCDEFLNAWNLLGDIANSVEQPFLGHAPESFHVYDKLFWGNNLPAVTPPGKHYIPRWSDDERMLIRQVLDEGVRLFRVVVTRS